MTARRPAVALALAAALAIACGPGGRNSRPAAPEPEPSRAAPAPAAPEAPIEPLARKTVLLYFPSASAGSLVGEQREILRTGNPGDQAKQILADLLAGPSGDAAVAAVPAGTRLRQIYVLGNGTAYADFSEELRSAMEPGSDNEILTVYAIVNSVALNVPQILRVGILVEGKPCDTLNGHLDLRRPLPPDRDLLDRASDAGDTSV